MQELIKELKDAHKAFMKKVAVDFDKIAQQVFIENPKIESVVWSQYAPYFNDGEPCEFNVNDPTVFEKAPEGKTVQYEYTEAAFWTDENDEEQELDSVDSWNFKFHYEKKKRAGEFTLLDNPDIVKEFLSLWDEDLLENFFRDKYGTDVMVILTSTGAEIQDYDHD